jgi:hypothetical protein
MSHAVEIIGQQLTRQSQIEQLRFMRETQGEQFAQQVKAKVVAANQVRKK